MGAIFSYMNNKPNPVPRSLEEIKVDQKLRSFLLRTELTEEEVYMDELSSPELNILPLEAFLPLNSN